MFLVLLAAGLAHAMGSVTDTEGAVVAGARVTYHRDLSGQVVELSTADQRVSESILTTDRSGHYSADIHPGINDVCVIMNAFTPQCRKVKVDGVHLQFPHFRLKVDPLIAPLIGDSVR